MSNAVNIGKWLAVSSEKRIYKILNNVIGKLTIIKNQFHQELEPSFSLILMFKIHSEIEFCFQFKINVYTIWSEYRFYLEAVISIQISPQRSMRTDNPLFDSGSIAFRIAPVEGHCTKSSGINNNSGQQPL
ncbi:unnamed protein product [Nesidiocoris tenuis]|uniref:Uncharacterized protein n=1 Tax=Nesidiocoris tenuis TaxID=355587 RepID=A0A6H5FYB9_9HEMI|nr:unnamed protein product [Nesidiocoris tenuis]